LLLVVGNFSCENKHIGRICDLGIDAGGTSASTTATVDVGLECPSRICLLPSQDGVTTDTTSLCTADCSSDDDCADAELRDKSDMTDKRCIRGFVCKVAQTVGDFCCRKLCVCRDFVQVPKGGFQTPAVCTSTPENKKNCQNIQ
jgi:hypothetical protein